jgi:hypothetical protein
MLSKQDVAKEYTLSEKGTILSPGKFEGEMWYTVALWDLVLDGFSNYLGSDNVEWFNIDQDLVEDLDLEHSDIGKYLAVFEDGNGFVYCRMQDEISDDESDESDV